MAATVKGLSGAVFGATTVSGVVMQSDDAEFGINEVYLTDEDGKDVAFAIPEGGRGKVTVDYKFKGSDIAAIAAAFTGITMPTGFSGGLYVKHISRHKKNTEFQSGKAEAIGVNGVA